MLSEKTRMSEGGIEAFIRDYWRQFFFGLIASVGWFFLSGGVTKGDGGKYHLNYTALGGTLLCTVVTFLLTDHLIYFRRERPLLMKTLNDAKLKLDRMVEHTAVYTDGRGFEKALERLRAINGSAMWVAAEFISYKLRKHFPDEDDTGVKVESVPAVDFSKVAKDVVKKSEKSIWLTCPYRPYEWFKRMYGEQSDLFAKVKRGDTLKPNEIPDHVTEFNRSPVSDKARIVMMVAEEWNKMFGSAEERNCLAEFVRIGMDGRDPLLWFINTDAAKQYLGEIPSTDDLGIYDEAVVFIYHPNGSTLTMRIDPHAAGAEKQKLHRAIRPRASDCPRRCTYKSNCQPWKESTLETSVAYCKCGVMMQSELKTVYERGQEA